MTALLINLLLSNFRLYGLGRLELLLNFAVRVIYPKLHALYDHNTSIVYSDNNNDNKNIMD